MNRIGYLICSLSTVTLLVSCGSDDVRKTIVRPVRTETVESLGGLHKSFSATVAPDQYSDLAFKVGGALVALNVEEGQSVKTGQVVAEIDNLDYRLKVESTKSAYVTAKSQLERSERLLTKQAISKQDYETNRAAFDQAKCAYENAEKALSDTKLRAPFDGFILKKYVENYQQVQVGSSVVCLINPDKLMVRFTMPESNMAEFISKPNIYVEFENYRGTYFKARVKEYVKASPDGSGIPVLLYINDPRFNKHDYNVAVGFACKVIFDIPQQAESTLVSVPASSVVADSDSGERYVFVIGANDSIVKRRNIKDDGLVNRDRIIVKQGLEAGETVVSVGATRLVDGQTVKILKD